MNHPDGLGIGARRITVSTVGHPEAIRRLAELPIAFNLALSMHMPTDAARVELMPGLGASDLAATLEAAGQRFAATGRRLTVEVVVLAGINDRPEDARRFAELLAGHSAAVNLIPWNPVDGMDYRAPDQAQLEALARTLKQAGIACTIRRPRGRDVGVACCQLRRRAQAS